MAGPFEDGLPLHPITDVVMGLSVLFGFSFPFIVLPVASGVWLYSNGDKAVRLVTVLGVRVLQANSLRSRALFNIPGQGWRPLAVGHPPVRRQRSGARRYAPVWHRHIASSTLRRDSAGHAELAC